MSESEKPVSAHWLNSTTLGVGLTSLLSDWSHEIATSILPALLTSLGAGPGALGVIEGVADGLSSFAKLAAGHWTDRLQKQKPLTVGAYTVTAVATGALAFAASATHVLLARSTAWLARGIRTPTRKAMLAAAVPPQAYGRAFGFERMMDTVGAIAAPATALWLLSATSHNYRAILLWTLVPGLAAALCFQLLVRETRSRPPSRTTFLAGLRGLPGEFRLFLAAVGIFGLGDFSHTLLILYATRELTPSMGTARAAGVAVGLYLMRNVFYALFAYAGGWLGDHLRHRRLVLAGGYAVAFAMALLLATGATRLGTLALVFALAGLFTGIEETIEDSVTAEIVPASQHGMAYGTLAAVNAVGDFASSMLVGVLWTAVSAAAAFGAAGVLFGAGALMVLRLRKG